MSLTDTKIVPTGDRFDIDVANSSGLSLRIKGGPFLAGNAGMRNAPNSTHVLSASATHYVEMDDAGVVSKNTTSFTAGYTQLYVITTDTAQVTGVTDCRALASLTGNADGVQVANSANVGVIGSIPVIHR